MSLKSEENGQSRQDDLGGPGDAEGDGVPEIRPARSSEVESSAPREERRERRTLEPSTNKRGPRVFDADFPDKRSPIAQWFIDPHFLHHKIKDLPAFVEVLQDVLRFNTKYHQLPDYREAAIHMAREIQQRSQPLRQEYNLKHNADIRHAERLVREGTVAI